MTNNQSPWPVLLSLLVTSLASSSASADEVDFDGLQTGLIVSSLTSTGGLGPITVNGMNPNLGNQNAAVIFDSANPTGGDFDLGTPNETFNGPGVGVGGEQGQPNENGVALGKILIIDEHLITDNNGFVVDPDDGDVAGSTLEFDFSAIGSATIHSLEYMDIEGSRAGSVEFFDVNNGFLGLFSIDEVGDNGVGSLDTGSVEEVVRMLITLNGSGAITGFNFDKSIDDCDDDGIPDDQEPDCDANGVPDDCEPSGGL